MSDLKDGKLYLLLFLSAILLFLSFWAGVLAFPASSINVGDESDEGHAQNFHGRERNEWFSFRWTKGHSAIVVSGSGNVPLEMKLEMDGVRPEDQPAPRVRLIARGQELASFTAERGLKTYEFRYTPRTPTVARDLVLEIRADTFSPAAGDTRKLGVLVASLEATPISGLWWYANWVSIVALSTAIAVSYLILRILGGTPSSAFVGALLLLAFLCLVMVISVQEVLRFSLFLPAVCGLCYATVRIVRVAGSDKQAFWKTQLIFLFLLTNLAALSLLHAPGASDVGVWMEWLRNVDTYGIASGYEANHESYPPLSSVILFVVAKVSRLLQVDTFMGFKLSVAAFLLLTSLVFFKWTGSLLFTTLLQFALILNSTALGYIDVYFAPALILSLWALQRRNLLLFTVLFSTSCLIKWQPMIIAPFLLFYILNVNRMENWKQIDYKSLMKFVLLPLLLVLALVLSVFGLEPIRAFGRALVEDDLSGNALNFNWVLTHLFHTFYPHIFGDLVDGHSIVILTRDLRIVAVPQLMLFVLYAVTFVAFLRREKTFENVILYSLIGYLAYFMFNTGVHENHLFLASILAAILLWIDRSYSLTFVIWSLIANMNLFIFYGIDGRGLPFSRVVGVDFAFLFSIVNVLVFVMFFAAAIRRQNRASPGTA